MLPQKVPEEKIIKLEQKRRSACKRYESSRRALVMKEVRAQQREWLREFGITLSPKLASKRSGIDLKKYARWRSSDPTFCAMFNDVMRETLEELQGAVIIRAMGQHAVSEEGTPLYDGSGRPIYVGGSDRLAIALLGLGDNKERAPDVTVNIDIVSRKQSNEVIEDADFTVGN